MHGNNMHVSKPRLILNRARLDELRRAHGIESEVDLARKLGVNAATLYRVTTGRTTPSNEFLAGLKLAFPMCSLDDLTVVATGELELAG